MKKIISFIVAFLLCTVSFAELKIPKPTDEFFVNDFANVISESDEKAILSRAKALYEKSGNSTQVVVVTVKALDGYSIEEYANELFNEWEIGSKDKNDGVLILLSVDDRKSRIEIGYGLEGVLTDGKTGRIQDEYMIPYYKNDNFSGGLVSGVNTVCGVIDGELEIDENVDTENSAGKMSIVVLVIGGIISYFVSNFGRIMCTGVMVTSFIIGAAFEIDLLLSIAFAVFFGMIAGFGGYIGISGGGSSGGGGFSGGGGRSGGGGSSRSF
ncbi:MAG: TPM domain-containing protein [bacterium]|nr:TPM domain-containing protein [bacterium]